MFFGDAVDQLHNQDGFSHARAAKEADFAAFGKGAKQVNGFDPGFQDLRLRHLLRKAGRFPVDRPVFFGFDLRLVINGLAENIDHAPENLFAHGHFDEPAGVDGFHPPPQTVGGVHGDTAHRVVAKVLHDLEDDGFLAKRHLNGVI